MVKCLTETCPVWRDTEQSFYCGACMPQKKTCSNCEKPISIGLRCDQCEQAIRAFFEGTAKVVAAGHKKDEDKLMFSLAPTKSLENVLRVMMFGAKKHNEKPGEDKWRTLPNGKQRYLDAAFRHYLAFVSGEILDPESGLPHLAHCCVNLMYVMEL